MSSTSYPVYYKQPTQSTYTEVPSYEYNPTTGVMAKKPTPPAPVVSLKIVGATATSNDGNVPGNAIDGNASTRWSAQGSGQKLFLDLGDIQEVSQVDITWYSYSTRAAKGSILVDNITVVPSFLSKNNETVMKSTFSPTQGKQVTIVCNGNTVNDWNSITEVKVFGKQLVEPTPGPTPTPEPCPPGFHRDLVTNECVPDGPTPGPEPTTGKDKFGITMLFPSVSGGRTFYPPDTPPTTSAVNATKRIGTTEMVAHGQGSVTPGTDYYKLAGSAPRMYIYKDDGGQALWTNIEITCYYNLMSKSSTSYAGFVMGGRSYHHLGGSTALAYYLKHHYSSKKFYLMKEQEHGGSGNAGYTDNASASPTSPVDTGKWYGAKLIIRTSADGKSVKLEGYKDETQGANGGDWKKLTEKIDNGSWNTYAPFFKGPACMFRTDGVTDFRYKWFSVRTISPLP